MTVRLASNRCNRAAIFANGQKVRKQRISRERLPNARQFPRPFRHPPSFFAGFIARSEEASGLCRLKLVSQAARSAPNRKSTTLAGNSRHDRGVGMMPHIMKTGLIASAVGTSGTGVFA
jgi:hypothetical protein